MSVLLSFGGNEFFCETVIKWEAAETLKIFVEIFWRQPTWVAANGSEQLYRDRFQKPKSAEMK